MNIKNVKLKLISQLFNEFFAADSQDNVGHSKMNNGNAFGIIRYISMIHRLFKFNKPNYVYRLQTEVLLLKNKLKKPRWKRISQFLNQNIDFVAACWAVIKTENQLT